MERKSENYKEKINIMILTTQFYGVTHKHTNYIHVLPRKT